MQYAKEHGQVLLDAGVLESFDQDHSWCMDEDCIVVVAEHPELGMVGGCRMQLSSTGTQLPFEVHLKKYDDKLKEKTSALVNTNSAELCGLWVAQRFAGHGLPWYLTASAMAITIQLPVDSVFCFAAEYSMDYACRNGFIRFRDVGDQGCFPFPTPDIKSYLLVNPEPISLQFALQEERQRLVSLRLSPNQMRLEQLKGRPFEVYYSLKIHNKVIPIHPQQLDAVDLKRLSA
jgi:hypothetical protein